MKQHTLLHLAVLIAALVCAAKASRSAPTCRAVPVSGSSVRIDGALNEPAWAAAPWQTGFVAASMAADNAGAPKPIAVQTRFKVLYDRSALYVGIECDEPSPDKIVASVTEHDGTVYSDDCVEIFLDPAGDGRYYHHFCINTKGVWYDDYCADYGLVQSRLWEYPLEVATKVDGDGKVWRVEVRFPFAALVLKSDAGRTWAWNVTRERQVTGATELSTWSPLKGNFHSPKLFGRLTGVAVDFRAFAFEVGEPQVTVSGGAGRANTLNMAVNVTNCSLHKRRLAASAGLYGASVATVRSKAVDVAAGASARFAFPRLVVPATISSPRVQIGVSDAGSGVPCKIVVKSVPAVYRPIACEILQPVYRQNIYATQHLPYITFRATLAPDIARRARRIAYRLLDGSGKVVRHADVSIAAIASAQTIEAGTLPRGAYKLTLTALGQGSKRLAATSTTIRKLPPAPGSEVRIDEHRNIVVNGKPRVFIGWYGAVPIEDPRADVIALQNVQTPLVVGGLDLKAARKAWREHRIYSIVSSEPDRLLDTFNLWGKPGGAIAGEHTRLPTPSPEARAYMKQIVDAVRNEPWVLGYYIADEPEINKTRPDYLEGYYRMLQEMDPYHPVVITNDSLDGIVTHGYKACDILNPDPYSPVWDYVPNFMKKVLEVGRRGKATMMTPWAASEQAHFDMVYGSAPPYSYRVMRNQYLAAIAFGCVGFTGYVSPFLMPEPVLRYGLPPIWREVRFLEKAICAAAPPNPLRVRSDAEMAGWIRERGGKLYLIVVNHKPGRRKAVISHSLLRSVAALDVVSEKRTIAVRNGTFVDRFNDGDARIYTTDHDGRRLASMATVAKDIRGREKACVKPGNLLHWSRGVLARASGGYYAPWFSRYFYYAINGVTDDIGWQLSHTDKPAWLDLTLAREEAIGRVVVYSPDLADYDLRFTGSDGSARVAEIRGSTASIVEYDFRPPIATRTLRITALRTRGKETPAGATLAEIEAYATPGNREPTPVRSLPAEAPVAP